MFTITNEDTGRTFTFRNEEAYEKASDWYHDSRIGKIEIVEFCQDNGLDLSEKTDDPYFRDGTKLIADWHDAAMELYARVKGL